MPSSLMQLEELQCRIQGRVIMSLGGQQGTPCQTLGGLEGQFQHTPNFNGIQQQQHLPQPLLAAQEQTLRKVLQRQRAQQHCALHLILQNALKLICPGSPQGVPPSVLFCATGRGASDNRMNHRTSLLYLYLDQGTPFHAHHNILYSTHLIYCTNTHTSS